MGWYPFGKPQLLSEDIAHSSSSGESLSLVICLLENRVISYHRDKIWPKTIPFVSVARDLSRARRVYIINLNQRSLKECHRGALKRYSSTTIVASLF